MSRAAMKTVGGMSVRNEIDARLEEARIEGRNTGRDEAIAFLGGSGFAEAAEALRIAAYEPQTKPEQA